MYCEVVPPPTRPKGGGLLTLSGAQGPAAFLGEAVRRLVEEDVGTRVQLRRRLCLWLRGQQQTLGVLPRPCLYHRLRLSSPDSAAVASANAASVGSSEL
eukprot:SAG31_NODE_6093_length_2173_cov_1.546287_2_plen_99_part_00